MSESQAYGVSVEHEPIGSDRTRWTLTLLLTARRCPVECVFCDLWKFNHAEPTQVGAIAKQIENAVASVRCESEAVHTGETAIKLYNGGNFTDPLSIPREDWPGIARHCEPFDRVIIENHANMCGDRLVRFRDLLRGNLEVAIGLETANESVLSRQRKKMTLGEFDRAARFLAANEISLRCFVMLSLPFADPGRCVEDAVASVLHAVQTGAVCVSIIATRSGLPAMQALIAGGEFVPPTLGQLERALHDSLASTRAMESHAVVLADEWDLEAVIHCRDCQSLRIANVRRMNRTQMPQPVADCLICANEKGNR